MNLWPNIVSSSCLSCYWLKICSRLCCSNPLGHLESCEFAFSFSLFCRLRVQDPRSLLHKSLCRNPSSLQLVTLHAKLYCFLLQLLLWRCPFQSFLTPWVWNCFLLASSAAHLLWVICLFSISLAFPMMIDFLLSFILASSASVDIVMIDLSLFLWHFSSICLLWLVFFPSYWLLQLRLI